MGKHYDVSVNELKILNGYLQSYARAPLRSQERVQIVNKAYQDLYNSGFKRWSLKNVTVYFNNNIRSVNAQQQAQLPQNQINQSSSTSQSPIQIAMNQPPFSIATNLTTPLQISIDRDFIIDKSNTSPSLPKKEYTSKNESTDDDSSDIADRCNSKIDDEILTGNEFENGSKNDYSKQSYVITQVIDINSKKEENKRGNHFRELPNQQNETEQTKKTSFANDDSIYESEYSYEYSCQSSSINSRSNSINMQFTQEPPPTNLKDLIKELPDVDLKNDPNIDTKELDMSKYELYQTIQRCYRISHQMAEIVNTNMMENGFFNNEVLEFQKKFETQWVKVLNKLQFIIKKEIHSYDPKVTNIKAPSFFRKTSGTTIRYNNEEISAKPSRANSLTSLEPIFNKQASPEQEDKIKEYLEKLVISPNKNRNHPNLKLENLINGRIDREKIIFYKLNDIIASTIVSYHLNREIDDDILVFEIARVRQLVDSYVLSFKEHEIEFKNLSKITTIYFYRSDINNINKFYVCGDKSIKEFATIGFDEYILSDCKENDFEIVENNTFYFDINNARVEREAITIWDDTNEIVAGSGSTLFFWNVANRTGEAKKGRKHASLKINIDTMNEITSLAVVNYSNENESFLAVASKTHSVIYIYDKNHINVSRLISHTMGISSLKSSGNKLFSGSLDMNVRLWDVKEVIPLINYDTRRLKILTIEIGYFFDQLFLFVADDKFIQCFNISTNEFLFYMSYNTIVPKQMAFLTGKNKDSGDFAKLVIISDRVKDPFSDKSGDSELTTIIEFS